jgi:hypothetical protein
MAQIILDSNNNLIQGDFDNATLNNRTKLQTTTTNATTNVYVVPNGSSTSAGVSVANNSSLTNASKIVMATNGSTDTQIISGVNGSGTYLPMSFYTNNALGMQLSTAGVLTVTGGVAGSSLPAGSIIQVTQTAANAFSYNGSTSTFTEVSTNLRASITPSSSSSKIIYSISGGRLSYTSAPTSFAIEIRRSTNGGSTFPTSCHKFVDGLRFDADNYGFSISAQFIDEPATTSSCMYSLFASVTTGTSNIECGSSAADKTKIILMEVKG